METTVKSPKAAPKPKATKSAGFKGIRKVRMAIASKGKGKSGGARVITYNLYQEGDSVIIDLLTIYDKGEISNISDEFISFLLDKRKNG